MTEEYKSNPGEDILFTIAILGGLGFAAWKFGLIDKVLGLLGVKKEEVITKEEETTTTTTGVKIAYNVPSPMGIKSWLYIKKNKANVAALQQGLKKHYGDVTFYHEGKIHKIKDISVDGIWGPMTLGSLLMAKAKEKSEHRVYTKIGMKFGAKSVSSSVGRRIIYRRKRKIKPRTRRVRRGGELYEDIPYKINGKKKVARGNLFYSTREDTRFAG